MNIKQQTNNPMAVTLQESSITSNCYVAITDLIPNPNLTGRAVNLQSIEAYFAIVLYCYNNFETICVTPQELVYLVKNGVKIENFTLGVSGKLTGIMGNCGNYIGNVGKSICYVMESSTYKGPETCNEKVTLYRIVTGGQNSYGISSDLEGITLEELRSWDRKGLKVLNAKYDEVKKVYVSRGQRPIDKANDLEYFIRVIADTHTIPDSFRRFAARNPNRYAMLCEKYIDWDILGIFDK